VVEASPAAHVASAQPFTRVGLSRLSAPATADAIFLPVTGDPLVSVVVPTRRGGEWLDQAVDSVLTQSVNDLEVLVVDDGVVGGLGALEEIDARVRVVANRGRGLVFARNTGNRVAKGRYIAVLDYDDRWLPGKLDHQLSLLEDRPDVGMCHTQFEIIDAAGRVTGPGWSSPCSVDRLLSGTASVIHSSTIWRREALLALGGYDPDAPPGDDADLLLGMVPYYDTAFVDTVLVQYRVHDGQASGASRYREVHQAVQRIWARHLPVLLQCASVKGPVLAPGVSRRALVHTACDAGLVAVTERQSDDALCHLRWAIGTDPVYASTYLASRAAGYLRRRLRRSGRFPDRKDLS